MNTTTIVLGRLAADLKGIEAVQKVAVAVDNGQDKDRAP